MRRIWLGVPAAAAAAGTFALAGTGGAQQTGERTLTFYEKEAASAFAFVDARPFSPRNKEGEPSRISSGDGFVLTIPLFTDNGRSVRGGTIFGDCRAVRARRTFDRTTFLCHGIAQLADGKITFAGQITGEEEGVFAVTGGTGAYEGARGTFSFKHDKPGDIDTIHLLP